MRCKISYCKVKSKVYILIIHQTIKNCSVISLPIIKQMEGFILITLIHATGDGAALN